MSDKVDVKSLESLFSSGSFVGHKTPPAKKSAKKKRTARKKAVKRGRPRKTLPAGVRDSGDTKALTAEERRQLFYKQGHYPIREEREETKPNTCVRCQDEYEGENQRTSMCNRCDKEMGTLYEMMRKERRESYSIENFNSAYPRTRAEIEKIGEDKQYAKLTNYELKEYFFTKETISAGDDELTTVSVAYMKELLSRVVIGRFDKGTVKEYEKP